MRDGGRLYEGGARVHDIFGHLEALGFRAISITEAFANTARDEVLQVDAVFLRNP